MVDDIVKTVIDGDTVVCEQIGTVRLIGINTAEGRQGRAAKQRFILEKLILKEQVTLEICPVRPNDKYGRRRAIIYLAGLNINALMVVLAGAKLMPKKPCHTDSRGWDYCAELAKWKELLDRVAGIQGTMLPDDYSGNVMGDIEVKICHRPGCRISPPRDRASRMLNLEQAKKWGYKPCPLCLGGE